MLKKLLSIFIITGLLCANACFASLAPSQSSLEIRNIQTRYFETEDTSAVSKAVINTLQDNGFIIQNVEPDLGFIRAKKEVKLKRTLKGRVIAYSTGIALTAFSEVLYMGVDPNGYLLMYIYSMRIKNEVAPHTVIFDSNIDIQKVGKRTKVRFSVIEKVLENGDGYTTVKSSPRQVVRHYEPELYQEFFNQVDKNLFIEKI